MMYEVWKTIPEYTIYEVSNLGDARRRGCEQNLKQDQYGNITAYNRTTKTCVKLRICDYVALLFIGERPEGHYIWHINGNKLDNNVNNLKYVPKGYYNYEPIEGEEWRDIPGLEGYYQVSNMGNMRSIDRVRHGHNGDTQFTAMHKGRIMRQFPCHGYMNVRISAGKVTKTVKVHQCVCAAFLPNPNGYGDVNHKNGDRSDNRVENLEWCSRQQNILHSFRVLNRIQSGSRAVLCLENGITYRSGTDAARALGIKDRGAVLRVAKGIYKQAKGYHFIFI